MRSLRGNDQSVVRALNRNAILNMLLRNAPLSRVQLKEHSGLSGAAVTLVVAELIADGLVEERATGTSTGGRPPVLLSVNYRARAAVGFKLMEHSLDAVLTDLSGEVQHHLHCDLPDTEPGTVVRTAAAVTETLIAKSGVPRHKLAGVGMGLPGVIDSKSGVCVHSSYLKWRDVPIAELLEQALGVPAIIDNDVNAFAAAERLFGHGRDAMHLVVVTVGRGIGAGLIANGRAYRGAKGGAGELGHTVIERGGRLCGCGKLGCLEAYASEPAITARANQLAPDLPLDTIEAVLAHASDERINALLSDAGERVGLALANLVNLFNPELIVIGGEGVRLGESYFTALRRALREHAFDSLADDLPVMIEPWGDEAWARGAACLAVSRTFDLEVN